MKIMKNMKFLAQTLPGLHDLHGKKNLIYSKQI